ncbi:hypothetical protein [Nocardiopsis alkaliphila]|uniref:hypothetical protein n=1 Tax=Nocardiopsis alkaliphila TaxID=225762 RepID=UPI000347DB4C|nr:hypothetical protein [Nocardiopsis alkaliphila]
MTTKNQWIPDLDAAWRPLSSHVVSGTDLSGGVIDGAFAGDRMNTVGVELLIADISLLKGTSVSEPGVLGGLRRDESGPALAHGEFTGGVHARIETPRRYGALGECPRRTPV